MDEFDKSAIKSRINWNGRECPVLPTTGHEKAGTVSSGFSLRASFYSLILLGRNFVKVRVLIANSYFVIVQYAFAFGRIRSPAVPTPFVDTYLKVRVYFIIKGVGAIQAEYFHFVLKHFQDTIALVRELDVEYPVVPVKFL